MPWKVLLNSKRQLSIEIRLSVAVQDDQAKGWSLRGKIFREVASRSYQVRLDNGKIFRRNRTFIRRLHPVFVPQKNTQNQDPLTQAESIGGNEDATGREGFGLVHGPQYTSFGRLIKKKTPTDHDDL